MPEINFADGFQQSDANAILRECNATDVVLSVSGSGQISFEPSLNTDYEISACVLQYLQDSGTTKYGFVGNEKYRTPEEGQ